ncbi:MAG: hypothetical protein F6K40_39000 [Okeania sp. SIO3I5]|uniref:hypothetical protein n=1 Tax=Okeania sp. SIO3I5 TaxID=2607805 RepID=UPI0013B9BDE6|nr:hypothetical protein [Okeania sp. SIO3I5]NEQ41851.1 hypothetical protein [Okeania sp. SIO3I5]
MGEAKRRKLSDPNYGQTKFTVEKFEQFSLWSPELNNIDKHIKPTDQWSIDSPNLYAVHWMKFGYIIPTISIIKYDCNTGTWQQEAQWLFNPLLPVPDKNLREKASQVVNSYTKRELNRALKEIKDFGAPLSSTAFSLYTLFLGNL